MRFKTNIIIYLFASHVNSYDDNGNRKWQCIDTTGDFEYDPINPAGYEIKTGYNYDNMNRLTDIIHKKTDQTILSSYEYLPKANGNRNSLAEFLSSENRDITYGYDNLNRLVSEDANTGTSGYNVTYQYDLAGNRLSRHVEANGQYLNTNYEYYSGTDRLYREVYTQPVSRLDNGNESYYAYADSTGGVYYRDSHGKVVNSVRAFFAGLPNIWSQYVFIVLMILSAAVFFVPNLLMRRNKHRLSFFHRGMCLLIAWIMFISPELFNQLSEASVYYYQIRVSSWGQANRIIIYGYDANGSVTSKNNSWIFIANYTYDIANRLVKVINTDDVENQFITEYTYNDDGIRVKAHSYDIMYGQGVTNEKTVVYLADAYNHTGYTQTLEEKTYNGADTSGTPNSVRSYLIGDDVIAEKVNSYTQYLLYDGHGSTRQLVRYANNQVSILDNYSYDGYGVFLQYAMEMGTYVGQQQTNLLYAGEQWDVNSQQYYNRARWYNPLSGLFNQLDPYSGNTSDPQSLHKYLYCHANPVNGIDPTGLEFSLTGLVQNMAIRSVMTNIVMPVLSPLMKGAATLLIGHSWFEGISSGADCTGLIYGGGITSKIPPWLGGSFIGGAVDIQACVGTRSERWAAFVGLGVSSNKSFAGSAYIGCIFNTYTSDQYRRGTGSASITLSYSLLPQKARDSIKQFIERNAQSILGGINSNSSSISEISKYIEPSHVSSAINYIFGKGIEKSSITLFGSPGRNQFGFIVNPGILSFGQEKADKTQISYQWYEQFYPDMKTSVSF